MSHIITLDFSHNNSCPIKPDNNEIRFTRYNSGLQFVALGKEIGRLVKEGGFTHLNVLRDDDNNNHFFSFNRHSGLKIKQRSNYLVIVNLELVEYFARLFQINCRRRYFTAEVDLVSKSKDNLIYKIGK